MLYAIAVGVINSDIYAGVRLFKPCLSTQPCYNGFVVILAFILAFGTFPLVEYSSIVSF